MKKRMGHWRNKVFKSKDLILKIIARNEYISYARLARILKMPVNCLRPYCYLNGFGKVEFANRKFKGNVKYTY